VTPRIRVRAHITQPRIDAADATGDAHRPVGGAPRATVRSRA